MLSRQVRIVIGFIAASMILVLLMHRNGYDFDHRKIMGTDRPESQGQDKNTDETATGTVKLDDHRHEDESDQNQLMPDANPTDAPALPPSSPPQLTDIEDNLPYADTVNWERFAYVQYVTDAEYLCNAAMVFETLSRLGSQADRVLLYPDYMLKDPTMKESKGSSKKLLIKIRDEYDVKLIPVEVQHRENPEITWADSYTKLLAFNQTQYDRVIAFDSDALLLQTMDELFFMPPCPVALPRAYWLMNDKPPKKILSTHIMLLQPSSVEFARLKKAYDNAKDDEFDMEIVNKLYLNSAAVLPHRPYALLTAEFRSKDHKVYLGSDVETWDPQAAVDEAKLVHFSDWPVQKPWLDVTDEEGLRNKHQPSCKLDKDKKQDCSDRVIWNSLYAEFSHRRKNVCGRW